MSFSADISLALLNDLSLISRAPEYYNYAGIGDIISHEFGHGLDLNPLLNTVNSRYSKNTLKQYKDSRQCLVDFYNQMALFDPGNDTESIVYVSF